MDRKGDRMDRERTQKQPQGLFPEKELATLGGGCFWCLEPIFKDLVGVEEAVVGYSGGKVSNPSYGQVCTGTTGHAEVVQITFNPGRILFKEILEVFFSVHDPTTLNRQGADVGTQYRSVIFYHTEEQRRVAEEVIRKLEAAKRWNGPIVTEVAPFKAFYRGEAYHQDYFARNPEQGYCRLVVAPKVEKFRKQYESILKGNSGGSQAA
jgi:peptide-methionine (S)-S-oxide reductase